MLSPGIFLLLFVLCVCVCVDKSSEIRLDMSVNSFYFLLLIQSG